MYAVCLRYANNANDAQDLLQEGFIKVYGNLHRFRPKVLLKDGYEGVFVNSSIEHFRKKSVQLSRVSDKEESTIEDVDISALDNLAEKDIIGLVQQLIARIPDRFLTCMLLKAIRIKRLLIY